MPFRRAQPRVKVMIVLPCPWSSGRRSSRRIRSGDPSEWGVWNYVATLACDGHRDAAEDEALAKEKPYRLVPIPLNA